MKKLFTLMAVALSAVMGTARAQTVIVLPTPVPNAYNFDISGYELRWQSINEVKPTYSILATSVGSSGGGIFTASGILRGGTKAGAGIQYSFQHQWRWEGPNNPPSDVWIDYFYNITGSNRSEAGGQGTAFVHMDFGDDILAEDIQIPAAPWPGNTRLVDWTPEVKIPGDTVIKRKVTSEVYTDGNAAGTGKVDAMLGTTANIELQRAPRINWPPGDMRGDLANYSVAPPTPPTPPAGTP